MSNFQALGGFAPDAPPSAAQERQIALSQTHMCLEQDQQWADIIYIPGTRSFWLLTHDVSDILMGAAEELQSAMQQEDVQARLEQLREFGILDSMMPPDPVSFLPQEGQQKHRELRDQREALEAEKPDAADYAPADHIRLTNDMRSWVARISSLEEEMADLESRGKEIAREQGYLLSGDHFYGGWEDAIERELETYRTCRRNMKEQFPSYEESQWKKPLSEALAEYRSMLEDCESDVPHNSSCNPALKDQLENYVIRLEPSVRAYHDSILALATLGIATPEWALADMSASASYQKIGEGAGAFGEYCSLLAELHKLHEEVSDKLSAWESATASDTRLPTFLFENERETYKSLMRRLDAIHERAQTSVANTKPLRVLIWNTDLEDTRPSLGYTKRAMDVLVRGDFPLREFSSALGEKSLSHLSLWQILIEASSTEGDQIRAALTADEILPARLWEAPETALSQWLGNNGCYRIAHRSDWHEDPLGYFDPEAFFQYLDEQCVEVDSLADESAKERWGEALKKILFIGPSREKLRLFDASAQAQMLRLVGMATYELNEADEGGEGPEHRVELQNISVNEGGWSNDYNGGSGSLGASANSTDERALYNQPAPGSEGGPSGRGSEGSGDENDRASAGKGGLKPSASYQWSLESKGTYNLAKGELAFKRIELPKRSEAKPIEVALGQHEGEEKTRSLGCYGMSIEIVMKGFAGANIALSNKIGVELDDQGLKLIGMDLRSQEANIAGIGAFAGVKAGGEISQALDWKPPRELKDLLPHWQALNELGMGGQRERSLDDWRSLAKASFEIEGSAGAGANADFKLGREGGKFVLRISAKLVALTGMGSKIRFELDPAYLDLWLAMLYRAYKDNQYETPTWITPEAESTLGKMSFLYATLLLTGGLLAARGLEQVDNLFTELTGGQNAGPIAYALVNDPRQETLSGWVQALTPKALGALLHVLTNTPRAFKAEGEDKSAEQAQDVQQIAISKCLEWIVDGVTTGQYGSCRFDTQTSTPDQPAQYLFTKAVARMTAGGELNDSSQRVVLSEPRKGSENTIVSGYFDREEKTPYQIGRERLEAFMDKDSNDSSGQVEIAKVDFRTNVIRLGSVDCSQTS
ncbi:hypothetical protein [Vreelandella sp. EE27]